MDPVRSRAWRHRLGAGDPGAGGRRDRGGACGSKKDRCPSGRPTTACARCHRGRPGPVRALRARRQRRPALRFRRRRGARHPFHLHRRAGSRVTVIDSSFGRRPCDPRGRHRGGRRLGLGRPAAAAASPPARRSFRPAYQQTVGSAFLGQLRRSRSGLCAGAQYLQGGSRHQLARRQRCQANGYPCSREGDYGVAASAARRAWCAAAASAPAGPMMMPGPTGNERDRRARRHRGRCGSSYATTGPPACAKNPIQVGAINSDGLSMTDFSSWGPCDDGRLKPVVSAPGCEQGTGQRRREPSSIPRSASSNSAYGGPAWCGTSMATPGGRRHRFAVHRRLAHQDRPRQRLGRCRRWSRLS